MKVKNFYSGIAEQFSRIPTDLIALLARICAGAVFFKSGLLKLGALDNAVFLFENQYKLPVLPPETAAYVTMAAELVLPVLLFAGLFTRFAASGLLVMTLVIQIFVYPNAYATHGTWAVAFLFLMKYGAGHLSLDYLLFADKPVSPHQPAKA